MNVSNSSNKALSKPGQLSGMDKKRNVRLAAIGLVSGIATSYIQPVLSGLDENTKMQATIVIWGVATYLVNLAFDYLADFSKETE